MKPTYLTITWGEQTFSPISYHSFKTGAITLQVEVPPGASVEQVHADSMQVLKGLAAAQYRQELAAFLENTRAAAAAVSAARGR